MFEMKINVEVTAPDLAEAITQLAIAIKGNAILGVEKSEMTIPAGTPMEITDVQPIPASVDTQQTPPIPVSVPTQEVINPVPVQAAVSQVPVQPEIPVAPPVVPTTPILDLDAISRAGAALVDQGKMNDILLILQKYGVMAVNQLDPSQYPAFADDLRALGANI